MSSLNTRVLVTGACGSVGSALVKRLLEQGRTVCAFDQNEDGLFRLDQEFQDIGEGRFRPFLGNIRDKERLKMAFESVDTVYHCAALKHVYISEYNPFETMQTNLEGVNNVINAAISTDVKKVIFTSSDKAVNPVSTMGATKLLGERLFISANHYAGKHKTRFACVRFGNVLNSNGSVLQIFRRQLEQNKPLSITSTNMTRFFITMDQAVSLCLYTSDEMIGGEIFVMNMGSVDILTIAKTIGGSREFQYTQIGLKPGEKLYEELVTEAEAPRTVQIGKVYVVIPDTLSLMPDDMKLLYEKYNKYPRLSAPLRSDDNLLNSKQVVSMLNAAGVLQ